MVKFCELPVTSQLKDSKSIGWSKGLTKLVLSEEGHGGYNPSEGISCFVLQCNMHKTYFQEL